MAGPLGPVLLAASAAGCEGELAFEPGIALVTHSAVTGGLGGGQRPG